MKYFYPHLNWFYAQIAIFSNNKNIGRDIKLDTTGTQILATVFCWNSQILAISGENLDFRFHNFCWSSWKSFYLCLFHFLDNTNYLLWTLTFWSSIEIVIFLFSAGSAGKQIQRFACYENPWNFSIDSLGIVALKALLSNYFGGLLQSFLILDISS